MRVYVEVARRSFRRFSTYRAATVAGIFTNSVFGMIRAAVFIAVVKTHPGAGGYDVRDVVTFTFISQGMLAFLSAFSGIEEISNRVRTGDIVTDFYRPSDFQTWWLAFDSGRATFQLVGRFAPIVAVGALVYGVRWPASFGVAALFALSMYAALLISFGVRYLVSLTSFWLLDIRGTTQLAVTLIMFGSGNTAPLSFFPHWLEPTVRALPFAGMIQTPADVWMGKVTGAAAAGRVGQQVAWAAVLFLVGRYVTTRATRRVVIQGG
ncbi:MAG TPA: ABC-2 family transporter protein [Acidimicrobiales bacterium]|nr:ABC-2 family transporter protein [Acidimicrobiales bacterium]